MMNLKNQHTEKTMVSKLQSLANEEKELFAEKNYLLDLEITFKKRIIHEIESKKSRIATLKIEIPELRKKVTNLAKILEIPIVKGINETPNDDKSVKFYH